MASKVVSRSELWATLGLGLFVFCFGLFLPLNSLWQSYLLRELQLHGQMIAANVGELTTCPSKPRPVACYEVSYQVGEKIYKNRFARSDLKTGQTFQLLYAPRYPFFHRPADYQEPAWHEGLAGRLLLTGILGLIFSATALGVMLSTWKKFRLR